MKIETPQLTDERLFELAARIKPIMRDEQNDNLVSVVKVYPTHKFLRNTSFMWDPEFEGLATNLHHIGCITTYHSFGAPNMFKPSIEEVLAQIPEDMIDRVVAFEVVQYPETANDLNKNLEELNQGYHVARVALWEKYEEKPVKPDFSARNMKIFEIVGALIGKLAYLAGHPTDDHAYGDIDDMFVAYIAERGLQDKVIAQLEESKNN